MNDDYRMGFRDGYREGYRAGQATRLAMDRGKRADALDLNNDPQSSLTENLRVVLEEYEIKTKDKETKEKKIP